MLSLWIPLATPASFIEKIMSNHLLENTNDEIVPLRDIIIPFLKGASLNRNSLHLNALVDQNKEDAFAIFLKHTNEVDKTSILELLVAETEQIQRLENDYKTWMRDLHVTHNLIHFLEFLSTQNYHRIRNILKEIHKHKFKNSYVFPLVSAALATVAGSGCYFYAHPEQWDVFLKILLEKLPEYGKNLLTLAMSAEILSGIIILFQVGRFFYENYWILSNKTTKTQIKFAKLSKINAYYLLSIAAQVLMFFNSGTTTTISSILFFLAAVTSLALTYLELYHHHKPTKPQENSSIKKAILFNEAHYQEQLSYYERKQMQLNAEFIALVPITIISITSIFLSPYYVFLTPIFACCQFLITTLKSMYINNQNQIFADRLQTIIRPEFKKEDSATQTQFITITTLLMDKNKPPEDIVQEARSVLNI